GQRSQGAARNLTPQPPSLRGKGEKERYKRLQLVNDCHPLAPPSLLGKGVGGLGFWRPRVRGCPTSALHSAPLRLDFAEPQETICMPLAKQTAALLDSARDVVRSLPADAVLLLTETDMDWNAVYTHLKGCRVLIAAESRELTDKLRENPDLDV